MPTWLLGPWGYVIAAGLAAVLSIGGTYYLVSMPYKLEIAHMQAAEATKQAAEISASLNQLQGFIGNMHVAATDYSNAHDALFTKLSDIDKDFRNATKAHPLAPDCKPDDGRVQSLAAAVSAANAASAGRKPSPAVPANP